MKDIHDINAPIELSFNFTPLILTALVLLSIILILCFLIYRLKKKSNNIKTEISNKLTAEEKALEIIEIIKKDKLIENNKTELFYFKITNLIKNYIFDKTDKNIDPLTTNEINKYISKNETFSMFFFESISKYLTNLEYIKFTPPINSQEKMINSIKNLEDIIRNQKL